jgi:hypothetical protein
VPPYDGEFASHRPLHRIAGHPRVKEMLEQCRTRATGESTGPGIEPTPVKPSSWLPEWIIALDGSYQQTPVVNGYPGAEVCYMTVAAVMLDVLKMRELDRQRPVHPRDFRETQRTGSLDCVLPGCNVVYQNEESASASFRRRFFEETKSVTFTDAGETLLDTYEALLGRKQGGSQVQHCPVLGCDDGTGQPRVFVDSVRGCVRCPCSRQEPWYSTDATRIYLGMNNTGPSGEMFGEVMQVWERLSVINIIRSVVARGWASSFARLAIVLDGPLAVFGHPAWLSQAIIAELTDLNAVVRRETGGRDLLLVGIEKSGAFVEHFDRIDELPDSSAQRFPPQSALLISNDYIRRNIVVSNGKPHGIDTYFGRKVFYKTKSGARIVATLPILTPEARNRDDVRPELYPRLADALSLLDSVVSSRYPNALAPLVAAHAEAAIPLNLGRKVLEQLAKELMKGANA